jgi:hypothetical protein
MSALKVPFTTHIPATHRDPDPNDLVTMFTMSAPPESQSDNSAHSRLLYPSKPMLYFHPPSDSLFAGADGSCYTEDYLSRVSRRATGSGTGGTGQKTVQPETLVEAFKQALRDTNEADLDLIRRNDKEAFDRYSEAVRQNVEKSVNGEPIQSCQGQPLACGLNLAASIERQKPFGSEDDLTPLWKPPRRELQPGTKLKFGTRGVLQSARMNFPCSVSAKVVDTGTGTESRFAMTATSEWLQKTADEALKPLSRHCNDELFTLQLSRLLPGTKEDKARLQRDTEASMSRLGGYLLERRIAIGTPPTELRFQKENEDSSMVAIVDSDWGFQVSGFPKLRVGATVLPGVECLPENSRVILESPSRGTLASSGSV